MEKLVTIAKEFAYQKHSPIVWKTTAGPFPQTNHLEEIVDLVEKAGGDDIEIAAAWLHDSVEDTDTTLEEIRSLCGEAVARIVEELTDAEEIKHLSTQERKSKQAERVLTESNSAKKIKLADQISNVRIITEYPEISWTLEKRRAYVQGAKQIANACNGVSSMLDELFEGEYRNAVEKLKI